MISNTNYPGGIGFDYISSELKSINDSDIRISIIKLEHLGYIEKTIETDFNDNSYYAFQVTEDGISYLLNYSGPTPPYPPIPDADSSDEDIPF